jgi:hypothetical protein
MWSGSGDAENLAGGRGRRGTGAPAVGGEDRGAEDQRRGLARPAQGSSCHRRTARARSSRRVAWEAGAVTPATETLDGGAWGVRALWRRGCEPWRRGLEEEKEAEPRRRAAVLEKAGNCWSRGGGGRSGRARRGGARASEGGRGPGRLGREEDVGAWGEERCACKPFDVIQRFMFIQRKHRSVCFASIGRKVSTK